MPTYTFSAAREISAEQQAKLVQSVTTIHHVEALAPRYLVQVIFYKVAPGATWIGGKPASSEQIWIRADIRAGRTNAQKARILQRIVRETSEILGTSEHLVWVYLSDIPAEGMVEFGHTLPEPGGEEQWFRALPDDLREKLSRIG